MALPFIDLRSDTVTHPTDAMRKAMAEARVGDDVFGEDPTVKELEIRSAERLGMAAGLFVPTGTMANQIAVWVHTRRNGQVLAEENSHIALYEGGAAALLSGASVRTLRGRDGVFGRTDIAAHIYPDDPHFARTRMVAIENTHNWSGGRLWRAAQVAQVVRAAHKVGAAVHVDGARIFNAERALKTPAAELVADCDSVMFCVSKGLSAPVGSLLCGSEEFIHEARRVRKALGGGMRQAGVLAAAGLVALDMVERLDEDHAHARRLAEGLTRIPQLAVHPVETNMVLADVSATGLTGTHFAELMHDAGVGCLPRDMGPTARFVTHRHITSADIDEVVRRIKAVFVDLAGAP